LNPADLVATEEDALAAVDQQIARRRQGRAGDVGDREAGRRLDEQRHAGAGD